MLPDWLSIILLAACIIGIFFIAFWPGKKKPNRNDSHKGKETTALYVAGYVILFILFAPIYLVFYLIITIASLLYAILTLIAAIAERIGKRGAK